MAIPTEPIGSIPRPPALIEALERWGDDDPRLRAHCEEEVVRGTALASEVLGVGP